jgi:MFS family permease
MMTLVPRLPRVGCFVLAGDLLAACGTGMTMPFFVVYLHRVRAVDISLAGLVLATVAVAGLAGNITGGWLTDRMGARRALMAGMCLSAAGSSWFAFVPAVAQAFGAAVVIGLGASIAWPALDALLASSVTDEQRSSAFALRHATLNLGFGAGAIVAASIVSFDSPRSFQLLYLANAAAFLAPLPFLAAVRGLGNRTVPGEERPVPGGYRTLLADRTFITVWVVAAFLVVVGYGQYDVLLPLYATGTAGLSAHGLALVFTANTVAVAVLQLVVLRALARRRRTSAIAVASLTFAGAWGLAILAAHLGAGRALAGFILVSLLLAVAETLLSPALAPIANDLAAEHLRGRYNGAFALAYTSGFMFAPALTGAGLQLGDGTPYVALLAGCCTAGMLGARTLRRRLPEALDRVPGPSALPNALQLDAA